MRWRIGLIILTLAIGLLLTWWPQSWQGFLEVVYGEHLYPAIQSAFELLPRPKRFASADVLWVVLPLLFLLRLFWLWRRNIVGRLVTMALETALWGSTLYLLMMLSWGLNYQRPTLYSHLQEQGFTTRLVGGHWQFALEETRKALLALPEGTDLCSSDQLYNPARPSSFLHSAMALANLPPAPARSVSYSTWSGIYTRLSVAGVYIPFTGEPTVNRNLFNPSLPLVMTHEVAHWAGYAHEYDADILAYWSLWMAPDPYWRISGWLVWWFDIDAPKEIRAQLPANMTTALDCYRIHLQRQPRWKIQDGLWRVYEANLNNQGVQGGLRSYKMGEAMALSSYQDWLAKKR